MAMKVLFLHIPKTAGTSLRGFLEGLCPESRTCKTWFPDALLKIPSWKLGDFDFIGGHYPASISKWLPHESYRTITFMREPVSRSISHFNHLKTESAAFMHPIAAEFDLNEFLLRNDGIFELANMQTRYLGASDFASDYFIDRANISNESVGSWVSGPHIQKAFKRACDFLEKCDVVGIVERMQDSMLLLADRLVLSRQVAIGHANQGKLTTTAVTGATLDRLREINQFDLKLYAEAERILAKRIATLSPEQIDNSYRGRISKLPTLRNWHYTPDDAAFSYGWHGRERLANGEWARWTASENAFIDIPKLLNAANYVISFRAGFYTLQQMEGFHFTVNGEDIPVESVRCDELSETQRIFRCRIRGDLINKCQGYIRLGWAVDTLVNPARTTGENDNRDLGVYLWWCGIENAYSAFQ